MERKRIIRLRDLQLKRVRTELRRLFRLAKEKEVMDLYNQIESISHDVLLDLDTKDRKKNQVREKIKALNFTYSHSPLACCVCGRSDLDLIHNPKNHFWYCEKCYYFNQKYYKEHPGEANWEELYP
jgi:hypothetical protein